MSDTGRKSFTESAREAVIPQESKPISQKVKESVTDAADRVASVFQPKETKSVTQSAADSLRGASDRATGHHTATNDHTRL